MEYIFSLVRYCLEEEYAKGFCQGRIYANTLGFFQRLEERGNTVDPRGGTEWEQLETAILKLMATLPNGSDSATMMKKDIKVPIAFQFDRTKSLKVFCRKQSVMINFRTQFPTTWISTAMNCLFPNPERRL